MNPQPATSHHAPPRTRLGPALTALLIILFTPLASRADEEKPPNRGSIVEDRAARKLLQAGDARLEVGEHEKALEIWESVVERYPRSPIRFDAHLRAADHYFDELRDFDKARSHYDAAASELNEDPDQRAYAILKSGACFHESGRYGKSFAIMRDLIDRFPNSPEVNDAYYYIGLGHFKLGHYSRAIEALEKVGTAISARDALNEKIEVGKHLYIRIEDADFAILQPDEKVTATCETTHGDRETVHLDPVGRNPKIALGSIPTQSGTPVPDNGILEVRGGDKITIRHTDAHTASKKFDQERVREVITVGNGTARITDGSYARDLLAAVIGKPLHLEVTDPDRDLTADPDEIQATLQIFRRKTEDEIDEEIAAGVASGELSEDPDGQTIRSQIDPLRLVRTQPVTLRESARDGTFRASVPLLPIGNPDALTAEPGQTIRLAYRDERHLGEGTLVRTAEARVIEGNLGEMRVTRTDISDRELNLRTRLRTAFALTEVGNHYKEFGLNDKAKLKYTEALNACENILEASREIGGEMLEETYVQLWRIYFAMDQLDLALGMSKRLLAEFPSSTFVDEAMLQQAKVERKRGNLTRAIGLFSSVAKLPSSPLRGEGQFLVAECYEEMALKAPAKQASRLFENAFLAYQKVYEQFPESGRVGDAVAKMAAFYYQKQDYARAIDVFENVLADYPDANFLDVILFNYGRCLYKLDRKSEARKKFSRLISDFPESPISPEANKIVQALTKAGF